MLNFLRLRVASARRCFQARIAFYDFVFAFVEHGFRDCGQLFHHYRVFNVLDDVLVGFEHIHDNKFVSVLINAYRLVERHVGAVLFVVRIVIRISFSIQREA